MKTIIAFLLLISVSQASKTYSEYTPVPHPETEKKVIPYIQPQCIHKIPLGTYCPYCDLVTGRVPYVPLIPNFYFYPNRIGFYWGL